ncbi:hypothetical protein ACWEK2_29600 [Streptomyces albidoflavus]
MRLSEIHRIIDESSNEDWHHIPCWGADAGPSFRDAWDKSTRSDSWELHHDSHSHVLVYKENVQLSISWGVWRDRMAGMTPDYIEAFPLVDSVDYFWADVFWNGSLVDRHGLVALDQGRIYLPLPTPIYKHVDGETELDRYEVTRWHTAFARLLHYVEHQENFDYALKRAKFHVVDRVSDDE